jgi:hypothetical protein
MHSGLITGPVAQHDGVGLASVDFREGGVGKGGRRDIKLCGSVCWRGVRCVGEGCWERGGGGGWRLSEMVRRSILLVLGG